MGIEVVGLIIYSLYALWGVHRTAKNVLYDEPRRTSSLELSNDATANLANIRKCVRKITNGLDAIQTVERLNTLEPLLDVMALAAKARHTKGIQFYAPDIGKCVPNPETADTPWVLCNLVQSSEHYMRIFASTLQKLAEGDLDSLANRIGNRKYAYELFARPVDTWRSDEDIEEIVKYIADYPQIEEEWPLYLTDDQMSDDNTFLCNRSGLRLDLFSHDYEFLPKSAADRLKEADLPEEFARVHGDGLLPPIPEDELTTVAAPGILLEIALELGQESDVSCKHLLAISRYYRNLFDAHRYLMTAHLVGERKKRALELRGEPTGDVERLQQRIAARLNHCEDIISSLRVKHSGNSLIACTAIRVFPWYYYTRIVQVKGTELREGEEWGEECIELMQSEVDDLYTAVYQKWAMATHRWAAREGAAKPTTADTQFSSARAMRPEVVQQYADKDSASIIQNPTEILKVHFQSILEPIRAEARLAGLPAMRESLNVLRQWASEISPFINQLGNQMGRAESAINQLSGAELEKLDELIAVAKKYIDYYQVENKQEAKELLPFLADMLPTLQKARRKLRTPEYMVLIPAGEFQMGSDNGDAYPHEQPVHAVYVDAFYMDQFAVTNAQYKGFVDANPEWQKDRIDDELNLWGGYLDDWDGNNYPEGKANHPVTFVSWYAAMAYAAWAGKRLPTEAEWEYAARGGLVGKMYPRGDTLTPHDANYDGKVGDTAIIGSYPANGYQLYDMDGNVSEWCLDEYYADFYDRSPRENPVSIVQSDRTGSSRVVRGGSWQRGALEARVAYRAFALPMLSHTCIGFRCVKDVMD